MVSDETMMFRTTPDVSKARDIIRSVCASMQEKGYNPINQIVGYLLSGDPAYVTSYNDARNQIRQMERDELLEEFVRAYIATIAEDQKA